MTKAPQDENGYVGGPYTLFSGVRSPSSTTQSRRPPAATLKRYVAKKKPGESRRGREAERPERPRRQQAPNRA